MSGSVVWSWICGKLRFDPANPLCLMITMMTMMTLILFSWWSRWLRKMKEARRGKTEAGWVVEGEEWRLYGWVMVMVDIILKWMRKVNSLSNQHFSECSLVQYKSGHNVDIKEDPPSPPLPSTHCFFSFYVILVKSKTPHKELCTLLVPLLSLSAPSRSSRIWTHYPCLLS